MICHLLLQTREQGFYKEDRAALLRNVELALATAVGSLPQKTDESRSAPTTEVEPLVAAHPWRSLSV